MELTTFLSGERKLKVLEIEAIKVAPNGLGFGEGNISMAARVDVLTPEDITKIEDLISSPEILVAVSHGKDGNVLDDDGCGDGRLVSRIFEGNKERTKSLNRAKVFGGGVTMAASTLIGLGKAKGSTLREIFSNAISALRDKKIGFGAHTDIHAEHSSEHCGCGAIDRAPQIVSNAVKYQPEIRASINALGMDITGLGEIEASFADYAKSFFGEYSGKNVMREIRDNGVVIKELDDDHKEVVVILNTVDGYTVDQEKIREVSDGEAQAFAVDVWRVKAIADRIYADQPEDVRHKAFLSELVYTLATAATLTAGDLPVFLISKHPELVNT